ncbi:hypothetical protein DFH06DRAFT_1327153 [Mycena polygramma]|nr:hypothetical protein DFH06DRAFT_1327153 [Mycena polygramma]
MPKVDANNTEKTTLRVIPNLKKLTLNFSGHLYRGESCLGETLTDALCSLKELEEFNHHATTAARTDFTLYSIMKLVSSWPKLRTLYLAGDTNGRGDMSEIPPATCALESVTFERCMSNFEEMAPMFAGSAHSLRSFEAWTMGHKEVYRRDLRTGAARHPDDPHRRVQPPAFIRDRLSTAPNLHLIQLGGDTDYAGEIRTAFAEALGDGKEDTEDTPRRFPALNYLEYPAEDGTARGRGRKQKEVENIGESALLKAAGRRGIRASRASDLEYKVEGSQRRAVFARRAHW